MDKKEYAYWLADKLPACGDFWKEAVAVLRRQADENEKMRRAIEYVLEDDGLIPRATSAARKVCRDALTPNVPANGRAD